MTAVIDLFAGPGGWDVAASCLGIAPLGIEVDGPACATREAAGLRTLQADIAALDPADYAPCSGLIASPPCQAWSMAGKRGGERDKDLVIACLGEVAAGNDTRAERRAACEDERSMLVVEPLRWALTLQPEWIALEQVPPVLGLWTMLAQILELHGWHCWAGVLEAERYGVPQTRERAFLLARRDERPHPPQATHQRYIPGQPQRHDITLEGEILPWVSMAEALGWGMTERPGVTFAPGAGNGGAAYEGGSGARATIHRERARGAWIVDTGNTRSGTRTEGRWRPADAPAPVVTSRADQLEWRTHYDRRQGTTKPNGERVMAPLRPATDPAPTIAADGLAKGRDVWVHERPATTVCADPRLSPPGWRGAPEDYDAEGNYIGEWSMDKPVRVTLDEAATLQSFPAGYPWQGTKGQRYMQIGNAVPPLLALAVLRQVARVDETTTGEERAA